MSRVFLSAGHELGGGASANGVAESPYNARVALLAWSELRRRGVDAIVAPFTGRPYPDELNRKVAWLRERVRAEDVALDIHLDINPPGCAVYAREWPPDLALADDLAAHLAQATGLPCRGGMSERESGPGRLGFLRLPCRAAVVELCSLSTSDVSYVRQEGSAAAFALGLTRGVMAELA